MRDKLGDYDPPQLRKFHNVVNDDEGIPSALAFEQFKTLLE